MLFDLYIKREKLVIMLYPNKYTKETNWKIIYAEIFQEKKNLIHTLN